jgi:glutathione reductase (NADPH)
VTQTYDVLVIGAGSGGMAAAKRAASRGASVGIVEGRTVGGTCVARGCMPKKFLVLASRRMREIQANGPNGLDAEVTGLDWADLIDHEQAIVDDLIGANRDGLTDRDNIDVIEGYATFQSHQHLEIDGEDYEADQVIIATGMKPSRPPIEGVEHGMTSDEFLRNHNLPQSMAMVGGGYIAVEFASVLNEFGVDVTIFQRPDHLIKEHDHDMSEALEERLEEKGIDVHTGTEVQKIEKVERTYRLNVDRDGEEGRFGADRVLVAAGREPNTDELGLENLDLKLDHGFVPVDDFMRTEIDGVFAVGDITGEQHFTPVAIAEGKVAGDNAVTETDTTVDYRAIPSAVFTTPEVGTVGLTESEARKQYDQVQPARKTFRPFSAAVRREPGETTVKLVYAGSEDQLVGLHVLGPHASEIVQGFALAMRQGVSMDDLRDFPGVHPTIAEEVFSTKP